MLFDDVGFRPLYVRYEECLKLTNILAPPSMGRRVSICLNVKSGSWGWILDQSTVEGVSNSRSTHRCDPHLPVLFLLCIIAFFRNEFELAQTGEMLESDSMHQSFEVVCVQLVDPWKLWLY